MKAKTLFPGWAVVRPPEKPASCILVLPGRGGSGFGNVGWYASLKLGHTLVIGLTPEHREWYPMPQGPKNQKDAVAGVYNGIKAVGGVLDEIKNLFGIERRQVLLTGFSAGAVMSIQTASHSKAPFAGVIAHGGAILEPRLLPRCQTDTPIVVTHNRDDSTFEWQERYVPMQNALRRQRYPVTFVERFGGGHTVYSEDIFIAFHLLAHRLGYDSDHIRRNFGRALSKAMSRVWLL